MITKLVRQCAVRGDRRAWNVTLAYVVKCSEEFAHLAELLIRANELWSGLVVKVTYRDYAKKSTKRLLKTNWKRLIRAETRSLPVVQDIH